jgi:MinD superfamily P-loop ATPase
MGSGGMIVMDEDDCMVDVTKFYLEFTVDESCGKCSPCRIGGRQLFNYLEKLTNGDGTEEDIRKMKQISHAMGRAALCALGQTAPNPVISTLKYYEHEYEAHIKDKKCPAGKCKNLLQYAILADKCIGCGLCAKKCPVDAIKGEKKQPYTLDTAKCIKCGVCEECCKFKAVVKS